MLIATQPEPIDNIRYALTILSAYGLTIMGFAASKEDWGKLLHEIPMNAYLRYDGMPQRGQQLLDIPVRIEK
jgi:hypothetical protein